MLLPRSSVSSTSGARPAPRHCRRSSMPSGTPHAFSRPSRRATTPTSPTRNPKTCRRKKTKTLPSCRLALKCRPLAPGPSPSKTTSMMLPLGLAETQPASRCRTAQRCQPPTPRTTTTTTTTTLVSRRRQMTCRPCPRPQSTSTALPVTRLRRASRQRCPPHRPSTISTATHNLPRQIMFLHQIPIRNSRLLPMWGATLPVLPPHSHQHLLPLATRRHTTAELSHSRLHLHRQQQQQQQQQQPLHPTYNPPLSTIWLW